MPLQVIWMMDYMQTLPTEVNEIWRRKWTSSSILYVTNRYGYLMALAFELFLYLPGVTTDGWYALPLSCLHVYVDPGDRCSAAGHMQIAFFSLTTATSAGMSFYLLALTITEVRLLALLSLRLYGIYGRSRVVLIVAAGLILSRWFFDVWVSVFANSRYL